MAPKNIHNKPKSAVLPLFLKPHELPSAEGKVYGLEIKRAMEVVLGPDCKIECVQKCNGYWRLILWSIQDRNTLLQAGLTIRGLVVPLYGTNPNNINGREGVRLYISNVYYSIADEEVKKALRGIGLILGGELKYENYKNETRKTLETKTGRRFIQIAEPTCPLPDYVRIAGLTNGFLTIQRFNKGQNIDKSDKETGKIQGSGSFADIASHSKTSTLAAATASHSKTSTLAAATAYFNPTDISSQSKSNTLAAANTSINPTDKNVVDGEASQLQNKSVSPHVDGSIPPVNTDEDVLIDTNPFSLLSSLGESVVVSPPCSNETPEPVSFPVFDLNRGRVASRKLPVPGSRTRSGTRSPSLSNARSTSLNSMKRKGVDKKFSSPKKQKKESGINSNTKVEVTPIRSTYLRNQNIFKSFDQTGFDWFEYSFS